MDVSGDSGLVIEDVQLVTVDECGVFEVLLYSAYDAAVEIVFDQTNGFGKCMKFSSSLRVAMSVSSRPMKKVRSTPIWT